VGAVAYISEHIRFGFLRIQKWQECAKSAPRHWATLFTKLGKMTVALSAAAMFVAAFGMFWL